jgi:flagellin-specific chaperone FliS
MADSVTLKFTQDEIAIMVDALEADLEGYLEAAKEARGNTRREEVQTFTEAAERIQEVMNRLREHLDED